MAGPLLLVTSLKGGPYTLESSLSFVLTFFIITIFPKLYFFDNLCNTLQRYFTSLSDFDVDMLDHTHYLFSLVTKLLCTFSLTQIVPTQTHASAGRFSLTDLVVLFHPC